MPKELEKIREIFERNQELNSYQIALVIAGLDDVIDRKDETISKLTLFNEVLTKEVKENETLYKQYKALYKQYRLALENVSGRIAELENKNKSNEIKIRTLEELNQSLNDKYNKATIALKEYQHRV